MDTQDARTEKDEEIAMLESRLQELLCQQCRDLSARQRNPTETFEKNWCKLGDHCKRGDRPKLGHKLVQQGLSTADKHACRVPAIVSPASNGCTALAILADAQRAAGIAVLPVAIGQLDHAR
eukprot:10701736-Prorocentrum_lima.AAC.1